MSKNLSIRTNVQQSQEHIENLNKIADQTDEHLRQALEHAAVRHEQLDQLHVRSQEMLNKNENLVFGKNAKKQQKFVFPLIIVLQAYAAYVLGITNYRKTQERDIFWRRIQYVAFGTITLGIIILLIILSLTTKRTNSSVQIMDLQQPKIDSTKKSLHNLPTNLILSTSRKRRRRKREQLD